MAGAEKVSVPHEKAFFVIVRIDKPTRDAFGSVTAHFARLGIEHVHAADLHLQLSVLGFQQLNVGFTEDDKQVARSSPLQILCNVTYRVYTYLQHSEPATPCYFTFMR